MKTVQIFEFFLLQFSSLDLIADHMLVPSVWKELTILKDWGN